VVRENLILYTTEGKAPEMIPASDELIEQISNMK
jgi:hypothetical protein